MCPRHGWLTTSVPARLDWRGVAFLIGLGLFASACWFVVLLIAYCVWRVLW